MKEPEKSNNQIYSIGAVRRIDSRTYLEIFQPYLDGLLQLEHFSHAQVLWWVSMYDNPEYRQYTHGKPPYEGPETGVFASRSPVRPNLIGLSTVKVLNVDHERGFVEIAKIDAFDDTPIIDIKAYYPVCDRVKEVRTPPWTSDWEQWLPDDGLGPED